MTTKSLIFLCLALCSISGQVEAQVQPARDCTRHQFGEACVIGQTANQYTSNDYGTVMIRFTPPVDINIRQSRASRKSFKDNLRRYFKKDTQSVSVVLELTNQRQEKIALLPLALATINTNSGVDVSEDIKLIQYQRVSAYFPIENPDDAVTAKITVLESSRTATQVAASIKTAVDAAVAFGTGGWLASQATDATIISSINAIEQKINANFSVTKNSVLTVPLTFSRASSVEYKFGFDPALEAMQTGSLTVSLVRRPSLFKDTAILAPTTLNMPTGAKPIMVPDYETGNAYDAGITDQFLSRRVSTSQHVGSFLEQRVGATTWSNFRSLGADLNSFSQACDAVRLATAEPDLGLNPSDSLVVFWSAFVSSPNATRPAFRASPCIKGQVAGFYRLYLALPPLEQGTRPKAEVTAGDNESRDSSTDDRATGDRVTRFIDRQFIPALSRSSDLETKQRLLRTMFSDITAIKASVSDSDAVSLGLSNMESQESSRALAGALAAAEFAAGCFFPLEDKRTFLLARRTDESSKQMRTPLWAMELDMRQAGAGPVWVSGITIRDATESDSAGLVKNLPRMTRCHSLATAPQEPKSL